MSRCSAQNQRVGALCVSVCVCLCVSGWASRLCWLLKINNDRILFFFPNAKTTSNTGVVYSLKIWENSATKLCVEALTEILGRYSLIIKKKNYIKVIDCQVTYQLGSFWAILIFVQQSSVCFKPISIEFYIMFLYR